MSTPEEDERIEQIIRFYEGRLNEGEAAAKAWLPFGNPDAAARAHIARHDPARVFREVAAGRRLVRLYRDAVGMVEMFAARGMDAAGHRVAVESYANAILVNAATHDDHPEWDESWRPGWLDSEEETAP
jgi:hypothetical protein